MNCERARINVALNLDRRINDLPPVDVDLDTERMEDEAFSHVIGCKEGLCRRAAAISYYYGVIEWDIDQDEVTMYKRRLHTYKIELAESLHAS